MTLRHIVLFFTLLLVLLSEGRAVGVGNDGCSEVHIEKSNISLVNELANENSDIFANNYPVPAIAVAYASEKRIYETAAYGHMGRKNEVVTKTFVRPGNDTSDSIEREVELFTWEKLDMVDEVKAAFGL